MELCERYLHYMSALCEGTMPAPPELALTADTCLLYTSDAADE